MDVRELPVARFIAVQILGSGSFGDVRLVKEVGTGRLFAMKVIQKKQINKYLEGEIANHSELRHPHVIQFREVFLSPKCVNIVMEHANGGTLFEYVSNSKRLRETQARWFFQQLILALDYCHKRGVANRDVKLENCLLHNEAGLPHPLLKICDFGYSKSDVRSAAKSKVGTLSYMAPEVVKSHGKLYDAKVADLWSAGIVLYIMVYGKYPFDADEEASDNRRQFKMLVRMEAEDYVLSPNVVTSTEFVDLLRKLLKPDASQRITIEEVIRHDWFLKKLPTNAIEMNEFYLSLAPPSELQTKDQIRELIDKAREENEKELSM